MIARPEFAPEVVTDWIFAWGAAFPFGTGLLLMSLVVAGLPAFVIAAFRRRGRRLAVAGSLRQEGLVLLGQIVGIVSAVR